MVDVKLYCGDCSNIIPELAFSRIDAVVTDPPYGITGSQGQVNKKRGKGAYSGNFEDTPEYIESVIVPIIKRIIEKCKCVVLPPGNKNFMLYPQPDSFGCFYQPASVGLQVFGNADAQPIFYYGNNATKKNMGRPCSFSMTERPDKNGHPCPKPLKTWTKLIEAVTLPGHTILDPFMGSGTTGVACVKTGRNFVGIEIDKNYFEIAKNRIEVAQSQLRLI